jgi:hypothetical protein
MALDALQVTRSLLSYQVVNDKDSLVKLLKRNGIQMPEGASDAEITSAVLLASAKSPNFKKELASLLASSAKPAGEKFSSFVGQDMGFTGIDDFGFTGGGEEFYGNNGVKSVAPAPALKISATPSVTVKPAVVKEKTGAGKALASIGNFFKTSVLTKENIDTAVQIGLTKINTKTQAKANQVAQEGAILQQYQDEIRNQQAASQKQGLSTGAWIGIGLGVAAVVGIVIFFATRKK